MRIPKHPTLVKRFIEARVKKLRAQRPVLVAGLVRIARSCAWITNLPVSKKSVCAIADHGGRGRWIIENQGFNYQKNSGLNLEHAYSLNPDGLNIFYTLLQIAHMIMQLLVKGSLLKKLARRYGKADAVALFGSLKNIARRLLECLRNYRIPDAAFDPDAARHFQLRLDTS